MAKESCFLFAAAKREKYAATVSSPKRNLSLRYVLTFSGNREEEFCFFNAHPILTFLTFCLFCPADVLFLQSGFESSSLTISTY